MTDPIFAWTLAYILASGTVGTVHLPTEFMCLQERQHVLHRFASTGDPVKIAVCLFDESAGEPP